jgi:hypothetical protein
MSLILSHSASPSNSQSFSGLITAQQPFPSVITQAPLLLNPYPSISIHLHPSPLPAHALGSDYQHSHSHSPRTLRSHSLSVSHHASTVQYAGRPALPLVSALPGCSRSRPSYEHLPAECAHVEDSGLDKGHACYPVSKSWCVDAMCQLSPALRLHPSPFHSVVPPPSTRVKAALSSLKSLGGRVPLHLRTAADA